MSAEPIVLCCLLWAHPGKQAEMSAYEDIVLPLLADHGGEVVSRVIGSGNDGTPHEVQVLRINDQSGVESYTNDPRRLEHADLRTEVVQRTQLFPVRALGL